MKNRSFSIRIGPACRAVAFPRSPACRAAALPRSPACRAAARPRSPAFRCLGPSAQPGVPRPRPFGATGRAISQPSCAARRVQARPFRGARRAVPRPSALSKIRCGSKCEWALHSFYIFLDFVVCDRGSMLDYRPTPFFIATSPQATWCADFGVCDLVCWRRHLLSLDVSGKFQNEPNPFVCPPLQAAEHLRR